MGSSLKQGPFKIWVPDIVRHPYKKDPKRDPDSENYSHACLCAAGDAHVNLMPKP